MEDKTKTCFSRAWSKLAVRWGWVVTVASSFLFTVVFGFLYSFGIIMVDLMNEFESSATETGYVGTLAYGISFIACLVTAPLNVKLGYRLASMIGLLLCVISCIVTSFAPDLRVMFFSHGLLYGLGTSLLLCGGMNITLSYFPTKNNSVAAGICSAGANAGLQWGSRCELETRSLLASR